MAFSHWLNSERAMWEGGERERECDRVRQRERERASWYNWQNSYIIIRRLDKTLVRRNEHQQDAWKIRPMLRLVMLCHVAVTVQDCGSPQSYLWIPGDPSGTAMRSQIFGVPRMTAKAK